MLVPHDCLLCRSCGALRRWRQFLCARRRADPASRQYVSDRPLAAVLCRRRSRLLRQARPERRRCNSPRAPSASAPASPTAAIDIVHSAVDNAVAMIDVAKVDVVIVCGGDSGTNEFYVQDGIKDFADIRGHAIVVDATNTAYALQAKKILLQHGLKDGTDYTLNPVGNGAHRLQALLDDKNNAGAILNSAVLAASRRARACTASAAPPTCSAPIRPAAHSCGATGRASMRRRSSNISPLTSKRCAGRSIRRTTPTAVAMLVDKLKLPPDMAEKSLDADRRAGLRLRPRRRVRSRPASRTCWTLRAETEGGTPADPQHYIDLSYYDRAMKLVKNSRRKKPRSAHARHLSRRSKKFPPARPRCRRRPGAAAAWCRCTRATPMSARSAARASTARKASPCTTCAIRESRKRSANSARRRACIATSCASSATICST